MVEITEFVLFKNGNGFKGFAKYFNKSYYYCVIKKMKEKYVVLVLVNDKWENVGFFNEAKGYAIVGKEKRKIVGEIVTRDHKFTVVDCGNRFIGL